MSHQSDESPASLRDATLSGVRWLAITRVASEILALGAAVALARLIPPAEFGRAAVALIFLPLGLILTFEGFASALVQRASITERDRGAAMLMSLVGGAALTGLVFGLVGPLWRPLFGAETAHLIALMSPILVISSLGGVSRATLWRALDWKRMSLIDVASLLAGSATAVMLAAQGQGARAMVVGALVQAGVTALLMLFAAPAPWPRWSGRAQREITGFGLPAALAGLVDVLFRNIDYAILAAQLSATQAGIYYRAFNVGVVYQDKLSRVMLQIAFPVYSRTATREELRSLHERVARVHAAAIFPLLGLLIVLAPLVVPFVFGSAWSAAVFPTQILAAAGMIAAILTGYPQVMLAVGKPRALLIFNLAVLVAYASAIWLAVGHGLVVTAIAVVAVYVLILIGVYRLLLQRYVGIALARLIPELGPALTACIVLVAAAEPTLHVLAPIMPRSATIVLVAIAGLAAYAMALRVAFPATWKDLWLLAVRVLPPLGRMPGGRVSDAPPAATAPEVAAAP